MTSLIGVQVGGSKTNNKNAPLRAVYFQTAVSYKKSLASTCNKVGITELRELCMPSSTEVGVIDIGLSRRPSSDSSPTRSLRSACPVASSSSKCSYWPPFFRIFRAQFKRSRAVKEATNKIARTSAAARTTLPYSLPKIYFRRRIFAALAAKCPFKGDNTVSHAHVVR